MANTARIDLDQDLTVLRLIDGNFFNGPWRAGLLNDDGATGLWNAGRHCDLWFQCNLELSGT